MRAEDIGTICPACGKANDCQIASDKKCWCFDVPVDKFKLEKALKDKSKDQCLCKSCLKKLSASYWTPARRHIRRLASLK